MCLTHVGMTFVLIYINDLDDSLLMSTLSQYADDTTDIVSEIPSGGAVQESSIAVDAVLSWSQNNSLRLNVEKTQFPNFTNRKKVLVS